MGNIFIKKYYSDDNTIEKYPKNILMYLLKKYPNKKWNWGSYGISSNANLTTEIIETFPDKPWCWGGNAHDLTSDIGLLEKCASYNISTNANLTIEFIEKYPDKNWHWGQGGISSIQFYTNNIFLITEFIEKYPDKPWAFEIISKVLL